MKRTVILTLAAILTLSLFVGCSKPADDKKIVVGATPTPHAEILEVAKKILAKKGYDLEIKEFTDYVQPNLTLDSGDLDANYFQHKPYLDDFNKENKANLVSLAAIHYEPFGIYAGKTKSLADLPNHAQIAVPNDASNEARALILLESQGLIKLDPDAGLKATAKDITENPRKIVVKEIEAAQLPRSLSDVDMAVINGNYALQADLNPTKDALALEKENSPMETFANILAVRREDKDSKKLKALVEALKSEEVKKFMKDKYQGAVVPVD